MSTQEWIKAIKYGPEGNTKFIVPVDTFPQKRWLYEGYFLSLDRKWDSDGKPFYEGYCGGAYAPTPDAAIALLRNPPAELEEALEYIRDHAPHIRED